MPPRSSPQWYYAACLLPLVGWLLGSFVGWGSSQGPVGRSKLSATPTKPSGGSRPPPCHGSVPARTATGWTPAAATSPCVWPATATASGPSPIPRAQRRITADQERQSRCRSRQWAAAASIVVGTVATNGTTVSLASSADVDEAMFVDGDVIVRVEAGDRPAVPHRDPPAVVSAEALADGLDQSR